MLCKSCHYPLKQLAEPRCPECGREFDPNNPKTYFVPPERPPRHLLKLCIFGAGSYLVAFVWMFVAPLPAPLVQGISSRLVQALVLALLIWLAAFVVVLLVFIGAWAVSRMAAGLEDASKLPDD